MVKRHGSKIATNEAPVQCIPPRLSVSFDLTGEILENKAIDGRISSLQRLDILITDLVPRDALTAIPCDFVRRFSAGSRQRVAGEAWRAGTSATSTRADSHVSGTTSRHGYHARRTARTGLGQ